MIPYLICFFITIIATYFADKAKKKRTIILYSGIAILIPAILAGIRGDSVGTDIRIYGRYYFDIALNATSFKNYLVNGPIDIAYSILTYIVAFLTHNFNCFLFSIQLIIDCCIYYFCFYNRKKYPIILSMSVFLLYFYNINLNLMRQSIAVSIFLCSLIPFEKKEYLKTTIIFVLAMLFHKSTICAIPIYIILLFGNSNKVTTKTKTFINFMTILLLIFSCIYYENIIYFLANKNIIPNRYYEYLSDPNYSGANYKFNYFILIYKMFWCISYSMFFIRKRNILGENKNHRIFGILLLIDLVIFCISGSVINIDRCGYYYSIPGMLVCIPQIPKLFKNDRYNKNLSYFLIIGLLLGYWYFAYIYYNTNQTYPFVTSIFKY